MIRVEGNRGSGKTTKIIELACANNATIIAPTKRHCDFIKHRAKELNKEVNVVTPQYAMNNRGTFLIDELECVVNTLFGDVIGYSSERECYSEKINIYNEGRYK